jgi:hypothetical protein
MRDTPIGWCPVLSRYPAEHVPAGQSGQMSRLSRDVPGVLAWNGVRAGRRVSTLKWLNKPKDGKTPEAFPRAV